MNEPDLHCHRNPGVSPGDTEVAGLDVIVVGVGEAARDYWRDLLEMEGIGIRFCTGQHATLAALADMRPDALLFDASSPHDWLADLRRRPGLAGLPVVVLLPDSEAQPTDRLRIVAGGADDALATPLDDARVAATLRARVARARCLETVAAAEAGPRRHGGLRRGEFLDELGAVLRAGAAPWQVLMALRVDQAKALSESLGQGAAFALEQEVAARFSTALDVCDAHSLWMQFGFGILARRDDREAIEALAGQLCERVSAEPFQVAGKSQRLTASVGIALSPAGADADPDRWFASAHAAQAIAHRLGGDRFDGVLSRDHGNLPPERVLIIREWVKEAVSGENVLIEFQPVLPLRGAAGLYRLDARLRDYRAPLAGVRRREYLALAREAGALPMIDRMSLFSAFEAIEQERAQGLATQVLVPLDLATLGEAQLVWLDAELRRRKAHSDGLVVEFEARMALGRPELVRVVQRLEDHGIVIALADDASDLARLPQLQRFPAGLLRLPLAAIDSVPAARFRELLAPWRASGRGLIADEVPDVGAVSRLFDLEIGFVQGDSLAASGPRLDYEFSQFGAPP